MSMPKLPLAQRRTLALASRGLIRRRASQGCDRRWFEEITGSSVNRSVVVLLRLGLLEVGLSDKTCELATPTPAGLALLDSPDPEGLKP